MNFTNHVFLFQGDSDLVFENLDHKYYTVRRDVAHSESTQEDTWLAGTFKRIKRQLFGNLFTTSTTTETPQQQSQDEDEAVCCTFLYYCKYNKK